MKSPFPFLIKQNYLIGLGLITVSIFLVYFTMEKIFYTAVHAGSEQKYLHSPEKQGNTIELTHASSNIAGQSDKQFRVTIEDAVICLDVKDQIPVGIVSKINVNAGKIYCWGRVINGKGQKIRYIWYLNGKASFSEWQVITSQRFLTWCSQRIERDVQGNGWVEIVNHTGQILARVDFQIVFKHHKPKVKYS